MSTNSDVVQHNNLISCAIKAQYLCVMMGFHFCQNHRQRWVNALWSPWTCHLLQNKCNYKAKNRWWLFQTWVWSSGINPLIRGMVHSMEYYRSKFKARLWQSQNTTWVCRARLLDNGDFSYCSMQMSDWQITDSHCASLWLVITHTVPDDAVYTV